MNQRPLVLIATAVLLLSAACSSTKPRAKPDTTPRGGVVSIEIPMSDSSRFASGDPQALDPQIEYEPDAWELFRCCLLRTLLSHTGHPTAQGGAELVPDLAAAMPDVTPDGLTWTFHLRLGVHYSPPLRTVEVTSPDFVRALEREARIGHDSYSNYFEVIKGFDDYANKKSDSISGVTTPDPHTLVVSLSTPTGDLGDRFSLWGTAPIPPMPGGADAPYGVATGHDDSYGPYLVSTGPYMVEGSDKLDFALPPKSQPTLSGFKTGKFLRLVRNPSWSPATDGYRSAYVDGFDIEVVPDTPTVDADTTTGKADLVLDFNRLPASFYTLAERVRTDPKLGMALIGSGDYARFAIMNLAQPPFDDIAVRKAANYAVDKQKLVEAYGGSLQQQVASHIALDSLEDNLLVTYDPYATPGSRGSVELAKKAMSASRYDANHDGVCDSPVCKDITALVVDNPRALSAGQAIADALAPIGIHLHLVPADNGDYYHTLSAPEKHAAMLLTSNWGKDFLNASNFITPLLSSSQIGQGSDQGLVGAHSDDLRRWGYSTRSVPSVDDRIAQCERLLQDTQVQCWASLDQYLMEQVVPWIPYTTTVQVVLLSPRVAAASFDQVTNLPALDHIALRPTPTGASSS